MAILLQSDRASASSNIFCSNNNEQGARGGSIANWLLLTSKPNTPASPGGMRTQKGEGINYAGDTGSVLGYIYVIAMNAYVHISNRARVPLRDVGVEVVGIIKQRLQQQQ